MAHRPVGFPPLLLAIVFSLLVLLLSGRCVDGRAISSPSDGDALEPPASDGISGYAAAGYKYSPLLVLPRGNAAEACEPSYGFLPCTTTVAGNLFLVLVYGFLMYKAATCLSAGSEMLLEILGPGIVGGLLLPILGALPDALLILVSGLSGSKEVAQNQVLIGMGLLAGSTVMLLTLLWGSCVVVGKCDLLENSTSVDSQDTNGFSLFASGITTDSQTSHAARIMAISIIPFIIVQLPRVFKFLSGRVAVLIALIVAIALLVSYCLYQVLQPWIHRRKLEFAKHMLMILGILGHPQTVALGRLMDDDGRPNKPVIEKLFHKIDQDENQLISPSELRAFIIGLKMDEVNLDNDDVVDKIMNEFDTSRDGNIQEGEFIKGISKWITKANHRSSASHSNDILDQYMEARDLYAMQEAREQHNMLIDQIDEAAVENIENPASTCLTSILLLIIGTSIAAVFADPLVDAVDNFSIATKIPSFFISFIAMPLATNSSEAVSAIIFASRKKQRTASLTFSEVCLQAFCLNLCNSPFI
ncbi:calcium-binding EF hand family protein [Musa troglodytarum]|uniref:Calcium-binding EF hand family protein n=1 Tax=Musa troglodytarum TaxID=320322 RepID=A0A9E7GRD9_9LILI|nr:calcium-binding EF hand family protein [Musa troglodytarum]